MSAQNGDSVVSTKYVGQILLALFAEAGMRLEEIMVAGRVERTYSTHRLVRHPT